MKQYECKNVTQVAYKIAELTNTALDKESIKNYCQAIKSSGATSDTFDYTAQDEKGKEYDVTIWLGYDSNSKTWFVEVLE